METKKVLFVAGESWPFIKTGGLGDVAYSLPKALKKEGVDIRVILPKYSKIPEKYKKEMKFIGHKSIQLAWRNLYLGVEELELDGIIYYFIDSQQYFFRDNVYGESDDCERFSFFSKAVVEIFDIINFYPDIVHCNDWHTGLVPVYLNEKKRQGKYNNIKSVFTIHNLRFQGQFSYNEIYNTLGLDPSHYYNEEGIKFHNGISFMKAGINFSDIVTTVSESYAQEIKTPYYGESLDGLFIHNNNKLYGITNGIDYDIFDPKKDNEIVSNFGKSCLKKKELNKTYLQKELGLAEDLKVPIISVITRLDRQKGIDLIIGVFDNIMNETDSQFIILGNGEKHYENFFIEMANKYPNRVHAHIGFNNKLAKEIYAGSDMFLMPSQFEPCGLSQLISLRYATIPIVRETGGLKDTVIPYNEYEITGNGFSFRNYNAHEMLHIIKYANIIFHKKTVWKKIMSSAMSSDNSWKKSGVRYLELYKKLF
ncbi:MAG: glycogen synthase GlgA [Fusobacteriaceae bacterium]|nr:glycogen synthase GlgA [Fusobacteriaceae bacterium]MBP9510066.1 glycogen synthase GlgA [Fusobacteriaceae bacterium]